MLDECVDLDRGEGFDDIEDILLEGCDTYYGQTYNCGEFDYKEFKASKLCCACQGIQIIFDILK